MPVIRSVWVKCDQCGRESIPMPLIPEFLYAEKNYFYALATGGWSIKKKENQVLCQDCFLRQYAEQNGIELPHRDPVSNQEEK